MHRRTLAVLAAVAVLAGLTGCAASRTAQAEVVVRIAAKDRPHYDVSVAVADGGFRRTERMRPGETRTIAVPAGWLTVRVPGLCVVPAATTGTTEIDVHASACTVR